MKIMLVSRVTHFHRPGGMPHVLRDRAEALALLGHEVFVVTTGHLGYREAMFQCGVTYIFVQCPSTQWTREFAEGCAHRYNVLNPDVLHFDSFDRRFQWWSETACVTMHGFGWGAKLTRWNMYRTGNPIDAPPGVDWVDLRMEAEALKSFRTVIGVSRHEERMLRDEYGLPRVRLVYNPIADYFFLWKEVKHPTDGFWYADRPLCTKCGGIGGEYLACGHCGTTGYEPLKRNATYFLCAAISGQRERGFDIAERACRAAGAEMRVANKTLRENMPVQYDGAKALLLPTFYAQGFDLAVCEARARGVPCIMSATGSYLAEAEPWDVLVPCGNGRALEAALRGPFGTVDIESAERHRPRRHAEEWLKAVTEFV